MPSIKFEPLASLKNGFNTISTSFATNSKKVSDKIKNVKVSVSFIFSFTRAQNKTVTDLNLTSFPFPPSPQFRQQRSLCQRCQFPRFLCQRFLYPRSRYQRWKNHHCQNSLCQSFLYPGSLCANAPHQNARSVNTASSHVAIPKVFVLLNHWFRNAKGSLLMSNRPGMTTDISTSDCLRMIVLMNCLLCFLNMKGKKRSISSRSPRFRNQRSKRFQHGLLLCSNQNIFNRLSILKILLLSATLQSMLVKLFSFSFSFLS